jgi:glycosyltransferase involved in cell wall biosynthesis
MFVLNDCRSDTRVLREAAALAASGHEVTIMARPRDLLAVRGDEETRDGVRIIRVPIPGRLRRSLLRADGATTGPTEAQGAAVSSRPAHAVVGLARRAARAPVIRPLTGGVDMLVRWRLGVEAWCAAAAVASPPADVWHAHDLDTLPAADRARRRRGGALVYDTHEVFLEAGSHARRPRWARRIMAAYERRLARRADLVLTVNDSLADLLAGRWGITRPTVVRNCAPAWTPPQPPPDLLRQALALPPGTPLLLYHGGFLPDRGLPELIAVLARPELAAAHLVLLGEGPLAPRLRALAAEPAVAGRVHLLAAVPPDELLPWVASADVGVMPNQPRTLNERLSTPNKLFESLAAGLPVVSSDFPERRALILDDPAGPLGAVCDPTDPAALAAALAGLLGLPPAERAALRARVLAAAHARYTWEQQATILVRAYRGLPPSGS